MYFAEISRPFAAQMPNPLRAKANGRLVLTVPLIIFMDDVSGNVSKQWNKHHAVYMSNASMPREMLEKKPVRIILTACFADGAYRRCDGICKVCSGYGL